MGVVGFLRGLCVHCVAPFRVVGLVRGRRGLSRSMGSLESAQGLVEFFRGRWIHWGAPWRSSCSLRVAGFIGVRPGGCEVLWGVLGSLGCALGVVGFVQGR